MRENKNIVIVGASSGIGREIALIYAERGYRLSVCARRVEKLRELEEKYPGQVKAYQLDVDADDAASTFKSILHASGDVDIILNCAGIGRYNPELDIDTDLNTIKTDCVGFAAIADTAFNYFNPSPVLPAGGGGKRRANLDTVGGNGASAKGHKGGQFAAISSIAGVRTLGMSLSYSASKRFQTAYLEGLEQLRRIRKLPIAITDIRPGFVATALLDRSRKYPMLMSPEHVARLAVRAIDKKKRVAVIDWRYNLLVGFWRLIPRWLWVRLPIKFSI